MGCGESDASDFGVGFWGLGMDVGLGWITLHYNGE